MNSEEILALLRTAKEKGYLRDDVPTDGPEAEQMAQFLYRQMLENEQVSRDTFYTGKVVGSIWFVVRRDPERGWDEKTDQRLGIGLHGDEWQALFFDVLGCPNRDAIPFVSGVNINLWDELYKLKFQQAIPDYPMLGRIWDMYIDVMYKPEEIEQLRDECLRVQASTSNEEALAGLAKLLRACDEASKSNSGLFLVCD